jgi:hypothetical protein
MATAAPAMTWLQLNVVIVDNDRGDSPSSYRARVLRAGARPELPPCCSPANSDSIHYQSIYSLPELPRDIHQARAYATMGRSNVLPRPEPRAMSAKTGLDSWSLFNAWLDKFSPSLVSLVCD